MNAEAALVVSAALLFIAVLLAGRMKVERLPALERIWLHSSVTWPILVKAALGSLIFGQASDEGTSYALVTYGPAAAAALALILHRLKADARIFIPGLILFALITLTLPYLVFGGSGVTMFLPLIMASPMILRRRDPLALAAWFSEARKAILVLPLAILMVSLTARENVIGECRLDKCSLFGEVLTSPITNNGNFAGVAVAILLPWALLGLKRFPLCLAAGSALLLIELSGSRSALVSAGVVVGVVLLASGNWDKRFWLAGVTFVLALAVSVVTAVGEFPPDFASWRGGLWARARELVAEAPILGAGPNRWVRQPPEVAFLANYSPHNIWLEIAVAGGAVAILGFVVAAAALLRGLPKQEHYVFVLAYTGLLALGIMEAPIQYGRIGIAPFALILPLMIGASREYTRSWVAQSPRPIARKDRSPALR